MLALAISLACARSARLDRYRPAIDGVFRHLLSSAGFNDARLVPALSVVLTDLLVARARDRSVSRAFLRVLDSTANSRSPFDRRSPYLREYFAHERKLRAIFRELAASRPRCEREIVRLRHHERKFPAIPPGKFATAFFIEPPRRCDRCT